MTTGYPARRNALHGRRNKAIILASLTLLLLLSACSAGEPIEITAPAAGTPPARAIETELPPIRLPTPTHLPQINVPDIAVQRSGISDYFASLPLDAIRPVYAPRFANAENVSLHPEELVIGIELDGEAKAYPVSVLLFREMVNDELARLPILVTW